MKTAELNKIDEVDIFDEAPKRVRIGKRWVLIRQLKLNEYFWLVKLAMRMYFNYSKEFINIYNIYKQAESKPKTKQLLEYFVVLIKIENFRRDIFKVLNKVFPTVGHRLPFCKSYLERHATINDVMQLLFGLYQYNVADVKKNLTTLMASTGMKETMVSQNLKNTASENLAGEKDRPIKPRYVKFKNTQAKMKTTEI